MMFKITMVLLMCINSSFVLAQCKGLDKKESLVISQLADRSSECFHVKQDETASLIFYALQIREKALANVLGGRYERSAKTLQLQLGVPSNHYLGGDLGQWIKILKAACNWDREAVWPEKEKIPNALHFQLELERKKIRESLDKMALDIESLDKKTFYESRKKAGLEVRETGYE